MTTTYLQKLRMFGLDVRLYLISLALANSAFMGIYGVLLNLYILRLGFGPEFIGLLQLDVSYAPTPEFPQTRERQIPSIGDDNAVCLVYTVCV